MEKVPTGIAGLDEMLKGGIPKKHHVLLCGGPGTGKTSFAMQYLYKGATDYKEKGIFISLEEKPDRLIEDTETAFGWDIKKQVQKGMIQIITVDRYNFQNLMDVLQSALLQHDVKRVVIDTITMLRMFFRDDFEFRKGLFNLLDFLSGKEATVILTAERPFSMREKANFGIEEFITDGVIIMYNMPRKNERINALEILKMRGTAHSKSIFPFQITSEGITVIPEEIL